MAKSSPKVKSKKSPNKGKRATAKKQIVTAKKISLSLPSASGTVDILKNVDLDIKSGERIGVVGPSGSGKTSLLMVLSGLQRATGGNIKIGGKTITKMTEDELSAFRRDNIGIVFQNFHLVPTMTALENVGRPLEFGGDKNAVEKAKAVLEQVGLGHRISHYPGQLSGGEQQRTALARALVAEPKLILADEPTGNLDGETGENVIKLLFDLSKKNGTTLILVTHDTALAKRCDRQLEMASGVLTAVKKAKTKAKKKTATVKKAAAKKAKAKAKKKA